LNKFTDKLNAYDKAGKLSKFFALHEEDKKSQVAIYDPESKQVSESNETG